MEANSQNKEERMEQTTPTPPGSDADSADARRGRFLVENGAWLRFGVDQESEEDRSAALAVRVPFKTDLSTVATREDAVDAAIEAAEQATSEAHGNG
ncbi:hypothetical protein TK90_2618 (plasmid) [Thioalkalivibrio sp. K90mix]|uniref:hypothetical protein n=1 Tax=Thioalkalivibrio sp. (strain K90mix) TaxID=396595 RepID=UPI000195AB24|nr:hypothetical protein [Thioalkalivibrio sp. K90mix]ADC73105.1 hypothetical protein TK90_2618 [Thioalkalivibrio sp. K90mix]